MYLLPFWQTNIPFNKIDFFSFALFDLVHLVFGILPLFQLRREVVILSFFWWLFNLNWIYMLEVIRYVLTFYILHLVVQLKANLFIMADYFQCNLTISINQINDFFFFFLVWTKKHLHLCLQSCVSLYVYVYRRVKTI